MINCLNCGAPLETEINKCPYCGTSYFDISCIDLSNRKPLVLKCRYANCIITQLVVPECGTITAEYTSTDVISGRGNTKLYSIQNVPTVITNIDFTAIPDSKGRLMIVETNEE